MRAQTSSPSPTSLALAFAGALALASLAHCAAAPPPPDLLNGPAYGGSDPLAHANLVTRTTSAEVLSGDGGQGDAEVRR